ncbi:hypothetical protein EV421DRAFT_1929356 [Armillaria borealis]|uniref:Uncharacterized protein n=1 Tax=Armillaria borealis TaxID=47425 RepID=A0AA39JQY0_9AGAR|nr:hypothetical protein EV421DRAFT_1929356 [Armillaria borealis]
MPRWSQHAEDSFRLPEGFKRIGAPGEEYGTLTPVAFSASTDRPEAFSDGERPKIESTSPAPKLTFSDFLPPSAMTSASSSVDQHLPAPPPSAYLTGAVRTALPKMQGVVQSIQRTITFAYTKGATSHTSNPPPPHQGGISSTSNATSPVDASIDKLKNSASEPKA